MNHLALPAAFAGLLLVAHVSEPPADPYPSEVSRVLATYDPAVGESTAKTRVGTARVVLETLSDEERAECVLALDDPERSKWTNTPPRATDRGFRLGDMSEVQLKRTFEMLATVMSPQGYQKVKDIMLADDRLLRNGRPRMGFGAENYWLVFFGELSEKGMWAIQFDGHHIAVNLAFDGEEVTMSPSFIGTQPSSYERDGKTIVPMAGEVDTAFELVASLSEEQRGEAIQSNRRGRLTTGPGTDGRVPERTGLSCKGFSDEQRALVLELLGHYVGDLPADAAERRMKALSQEVDEMVFAWWGPTENPGDVSYRLQGPSVVVEYACQDLGGNPLDHLHSMYRDPNNEYGARYSRGF